MNYGIDAPKTPSLLLKKTGFLKKSALLVSSCLLAFSAQTAMASQLSDLKAGSYGSKLQMDGVDLTTDPKAAKIDKGSSEPNKKKVGSITRGQLQEIAETKMPDLNANDIEAAMKIIEGTARNMGVTVSD